MSRPRKQLSIMWSRNCEPLRKPTRGITMERQVQSAAKPHACCALHTTAGSQPSAITVRRWLVVLRSTLHRLSHPVCYRTPFLKRLRSSEGLQATTTRCCSGSKHRGTKRAARRLQIAFQPPALLLSLQHHLPLPHPLRLWYQPLFRQSTRVRSWRSCRGSSRCLQPSSATLGGSRSSCDPGSLSWTTSLYVAATATVILLHWSHIRCYCGQRGHLPRTAACARGGLHRRQSQTAHSSGRCSTCSRPRLPAIA